MLMWAAFYGVMSLRMLGAFGTIAATVFGLVLVVSLAGPLYLRGAGDPCFAQALVRWD